MGMEVNNHVNVIFDGRFYGLIQHGLVEIGLCKIVTIGPLAHVVYRHGSANQLDVLPFHKSGNNILFPVPLLICSTTPEEAHALDLHLVAARTEMPAAAVNPTVLSVILARLQLAVLAHGSNALGRDGLSLRRSESDAQRQQAKHENKGKIVFGHGNSIPFVLLQNNYNFQKPPQPF